MGTTNLNVFVPKILTAIGAVLLATLTVIVLTFSSSDNVVWVRGAAVYEGEVNQFIMTKEAMEQAAVSFIGKPILMGHDWTDPHACVGVIVDTAVRHDPIFNLYYLEFTAIIDNDDAEARIKKGLFKRLSIGFETSEIVCSLDDTDMRLCGHSPGTWHVTPEGLKQALGIIKKLSGFEISFINVPASAPARILEWSDDLLELSTGN